jgi:hypothetical protein
MKAEEVLVPCCFVAMKVVPGVAICQRVLGVRRLQLFDLRMLVGVHFASIRPSPVVH